MHTKWNSNALEGLVDQLEESSCNKFPPNIKAAAILLCMAIAFALLGAGIASGLLVTSAVYRFGVGIGIKESDVRIRNYLEDSCLETQED